MNYYLQSTNVARSNTKYTTKWNWDATKVELTGKVLSKAKLDCSEANDKGCYNAVRVKMFNCISILML